MKNDDLFNYLVATDQLDEFLGKKEIIVANKIKCVYCGDIIESKTTNDFKRCSCGTVAIDGGHEFLKRIGAEEDYIELSEVE